MIPQAGAQVSVCCYSRWISKDSTISVCLLRQLFLQQIFPALPCIFSRLLIPSSRIWRFPGTHETVASVFIRDGFISFAGCFHVRLSVGDGGSNTCVVL